MKRIVQSRTGEDGTCFRACVASIVGVPEKRIPDFGAGGDDDKWWTDIQSWLGKAGLAYVRIPIDGSKPVGYSTIEGISPRGGMHACVAFDGELTWDPHPIEDGTGQGLVEPRYYGIFRKIGRARDTKKFNPAAWHAGNATSDSTTLFRDIAMGEYFLWRFGSDLLTLKKIGKQQGEHPDGTKQWVSLNYLTRKVGKPSRRAKDRADMLQLRKNTARQGGPFFIQETTKSGNERTIPVRNLAKGADEPRQRALDFVVLNFTMQENSATTWDYASEHVRRAWLASKGLNIAAAAYQWNEQSSKVQNSFVDWYRANHNV